jgi:pimeloyl-ACP methyl ester carboxylesterase
MGLGGIKTNWQRQTKYFGHDNHARYSVLILDNRGVGHSDKPLVRYSTSIMAEDVRELLDHLGWLSSPRAIHVVGISLGGMIAQELALRIPDHLSSLTLVSTTAHMVSANPKSMWGVLYERAGMVIPKPLDRAIRDTSREVFPEAWLAMEDDADLPSPVRTHRCGPAPGTPDGEYPRFHSNFQRWQAAEVTKRTDKSMWAAKGFLMQLIAAGWHYKSPAQLKEMADKVGRERITILHGDGDKMIDTHMGKKLIEAVRPGTSLLVPDIGHAPIVSASKWFNGLLEERIAACEAL